MVAPSNPRKDSPPADRAAADSLARSTRWASWGLLGALTMTVLAAIRAHEGQALERRREITHATERLQKSLQDHLDRYRALVESGQALLGASDLVTTRDWNRFGELIGVPQRFPGLQGVSFNPYVEPAQHAALERGFQDQGLKDYRIWPAPQGVAACPVGYILPLDTANARAVGYDILSDASRRAGVEEARDTGGIVMTPPVALAQGGVFADLQGFLLAGPVYAGDTRPGSVEARRGAFRGVVVAVFQMQDLVRAAFERVDIDEGWDLEIRDSADPGSPTIYDHAPQFDAAAFARRQPPDERLSVNAGGRTWHLFFGPTSEAVFGGGGREYPWVILGGGLVISALLFALTRSLGITEQRARNLAEAMTHDLRETQVALQRTADELGAVLNALPDLFFRIRADGTILEFHSASSDALYRTPPEFLGRRIVDYLPLETARSLQARIGEAARSRTLVSADYSLPIGEEVRHFEARIQPFGANELVVLTRDITARVRAARALEESEQRLRAIVETIQQVFWVGKPGALAPLYISPAAERIWGRPTEALLRMGQLSDSGVVPDDQDLLRDAIERQAQGETTSIEYRIQRPDGSVRWIWDQGFPVRDSSGTVTVINGIATDITDRKLAEEALAENETRLATVVESAMDAILSIDDAACICVFNSAAQRMFGWTAAEATGRPLDLVLVDPTPFTGQPSTPPAGALPARAAILGRRRNGEEFPLEASASESAASGRIIRTLILRDVTERVKAEQERQALEHQLRQSQKMQAIGTLAGGIAHDFNNILGSIIGFTELARIGAEDNRRVTENLDEVLQAGRRAKEVVQQILAFSRREEGSPRTLELGAVVSEVVRLLRAGLSSNIHLVTDLAPGSPHVIADPTQIHQLIMNLATNAAYAMRERGGHLAIQVSSWHPDDVAEAAMLGERPRTLCVRLRVQDTGAGMEPGVVERIFEPFFTTKAPGEGTGLGLAVVHGIVKNHHAHIEVDSSPGLGSTFDVYFPAAASNALAPEGVASTDSMPRGNGERILFVDDEGGLTRAARRALEFCGYEVLTFTDPAEALAAFRKEPKAFDLVITDLTMPGMDGSQLAAEILRIRPGFPVLLSTGFGGGINAQSAARLGVRELIHKPTDLRTLSEAVARALRSS